MLIQVGDMHLMLLELLKEFIRSGAAGMHIEDQVAAKKMWTQTK